MNIRYCVDLSQAERDELTALLGGGKHPARKIKRAQILLAADAGIDDETIAASVAVSGSTVYRTKRRFVEGNWKPPSARSPGLVRRASSQARKKRFWWRPPAPSRPRGVRAGR
jgi:hypothetical protein